MKIVSITCHPLHGILGLGDDNRVYKFSSNYNGYGQATWVLLIQEGE